MTAPGFDELADLALRKSGHAFRVNQKYLMEARLSDILRRESFSELAELADCLSARPNPVLEDEVVAAMLGKDTHFFKDRDRLTSIVSELLPSIARRHEERGETRPIRLWCAGGGSGQEAYSLAMLLDEANEDVFLGRAIEIVSTDICKRSCEQASAGLYNHYEIQRGLSARRMLKYFTKADDLWRANDTLRERVTFGVQNLMDPFDGGELYDIVLCRDVLNDLLTPIALDISRRLGATLQDEGCLFLAKNEELPVDIGFNVHETVEGAWCYVR